jgi:PPOX class probable F420-dependent enzyme
VGIAFDETTRRLLDGKNFATVATVGPTGAPESSVVWIKRTGDTVDFSTTTDRQKARNLFRDPRISVSVFAIENPYASIEIRGTAELIEDEEKALSSELSHKYLGEDPPSEPDDVVRLIVRVVPTKVIAFST